MIKVGIIGAGRNGAGHCKIFTETHGERCRIVGVADINIDAASELAGQFGAKSFITAEELFGEVEGEEPEQKSNFILNPGMSDIDN